MAEVIGPGATKRQGGAKTGKSIGPGGAGGLGPDMTTRRGYESRRLTGLRTEYRVSGRAENGKAGR